MTPPPGAVEARKCTLACPPLQPKVISADCLRMPEGTWVRVMAASAALTAARATMNRDRRADVGKRNRDAMSVTVLHAGFEQGNRERDQGNGGREIRADREVVADVHGG